MCRPWIIVAGLLCSIVSSASAEQQAAQGILILDDSGGAASGPFYRDIVSALRGSVNRDPSKQYSIYVEHLDLNRFRGPEYELGLKTFFATKYKDRPLGVIVAVGVGALQYVLRSRVELWPAVPVVFTFVDPQLLSALSLPADVTGTTFRLKLFDMVAAGRVVVPDLNQIAVVGDPLGTSVPYRHMQDEIPAVTATGLHIIDLTGMSLRNVRARVANLPVRTAILYPGMYSDGEGTYLTPVEGLRRFAEVANRPIIVTAETQLGPGTGGYIAVPSTIGQGAAVQVLSILQGERATAIPVSEGNFVKPIFDWRQLRRWGISESTLPPGSEIRFREPTIWQQYFWQMMAILAALVMQTWLIVALIWEDRRRRRSEANAQALTGELAHMNRVATAGQLTASIAHEIRQPLSSIASFGSAGLRWLKHDPPNLDKARSGLENVVAQVHRADDVIKSVTALFKNESTTRTEVYVNALVQQVLVSTAQARNSNGILLETNLVESPPPYVSADPVQLQQVILNLITNAIDAMSASKQGARILLIETNIDQDDTAVIKVADTGPGFDSKVAAQLFKPFFTTKSSGMGLGLPICKSIIEAHQGTLTVASREPHGAVFRIELPRHRQETN
jgi:signal transduction histidine kinase